MITICGEGLVDLVPSPTITGEPHAIPLHPALGGGPFNVAIATARLGAPPDSFRASPTTPSEQHYTTG